MQENKRKFIAVKDITDAEDPDILTHIKENMIKMYDNELKSHFIFIHLIHDLIDKYVKNDLKSELNMKISKAGFIEAVTICESHIGSFLSIFQSRKLNKASELVENYYDINDGINECLKTFEKPHGLDNKKEKILLYFKLRNQFAHNSRSCFSIKDRESALEAFLTNLNGIITQSSYWAYNNGEAGVAIPYSIISDGFIYDFITESIDFLSLLYRSLFSKEIG